MKLLRTALPGVLILTPTVYRDSRGLFFESWSQSRFASAEITENWVQDNCSLSKKGVVRGLHYQIVKPQAKLVRVAHGAVLDVAVDLRRSSSTFGRHITVELTAENAAMLYIPVGFAHGFVALTETAVLAYKVSNDYCPEGERTILWNDPQLAIEWPVRAEEAIISEKDLRGSNFSDAEVFA